MPHTSHRSLPHKREVTDDDGWTRITSSQRKRKAPNPPVEAANIGLATYSPVELDRAVDGSQPTRVFEPRHLTLEQVSRRFEKNEKVWLSSESWRVLKASLQAHLKNARPIESCIIFGSGSFSGYRGNWIERWDVGFIQLAVLKAVADSIEQYCGVRPLCYAQEPCYNNLDIQFLKTLSITTVETPKGFDLVNPGTFAYTAHTVAPVVSATIYRNPAMLLNHVMDDHYWRDKNGLPVSNRLRMSAKCEGDSKQPMRLEDYEKATGDVDEKVHDSLEKQCQAGKTFQKAYDGIKLPNLEVANFPFQDQYLYCRTSQEVDEMELGGEGL